MEVYIKTERTRDQLYQDKALDIVENDFNKWVESLASERIKIADVYDEVVRHIRTTRNPLKRIGTINTVIFGRAGSRRAKRKDSLTNDYLEYVDVKDLDIKLERAETLTNTMGDSFIQLYKNESTDKIMCKTIYANDIVHIDEEDGVLHP